MAFIKCPNCGTLISDRAENCPKCGAYMENHLPLTEHSIKAYCVSAQTESNTIEIETPKEAPDTNNNLDLGASDSKNPSVNSGASIPTKNDIAAIKEETKDTKTSSQDTVKQEKKHRSPIVIGVLAALALVGAFLLFHDKLFNPTPTIQQEESTQQVVEQNHSTESEPDVVDNSWLLGTWRSKEDDLGYTTVLFEGDGTKGNVKMTMYFPSEISNVPAITYGTYVNDGNSVKMTFEGESESWSVNNSHDVLSSSDGMYLRKEVTSSNMVEPSKVKTIFDYLTDSEWDDHLTTYPEDHNAYTFSKDNTFCYTEYTYDDEGNEIKKESKGTYSLDGNTIELVDENGNINRLLLDNERLVIKGDTKTYKCWESLNSIYHINNDLLYYSDFNKDYSTYKPNTCRLIDDSNGVLGLEINQYQGKTWDDFPDNLGNPTKTIRLFAKNRKYLYDSEGNLQAIIDEVGDGGFKLKGDGDKWFLGGYGIE